MADDILEQYLTSQTPGTDARCKKCGFLLDPDDTDGLCLDCKEDGEVASGGLGDA
jgi:predicted Zn-ribbon and HTH transcriptional regulator